MTFKGSIFYYICVFLAVCALSISNTHPASAYLTNGANAIDLLGQYDQTSFTDPVPVYGKSGANDGANKFGFSGGGSTSCCGIAIDTTNHRLFVADRSNNRVLVYTLTVGNLLADHMPDNVIGQTNFYSNASATSQPGLNSPSGLAFDATNNRLYVTNSSRITIYNTSSITDGMNAVNVLGQTTFSASSAATTQLGVSSPVGLAVDPANNNLYVADTTNNRILRYNISTITNGMNAADLLGQDDGSNFTDPVPIYSKSGVNNGANKFGFSTSGNLKMGVAIDGTNHRLFVTDYANHRVLVYNLSVGNLLTDHLADNVIGQADFYSNASATSQPGLHSPAGLAFDATNNRLYVAANGNHRIAVFNTSTITNGMNAVNVIGQSAFNGASGVSTQPGLLGPEAVAIDVTRNLLYVAQGVSGNRVTVYDTSTITNGENAVNVLGQTTFSGSTAAVTQPGMYSANGVALDSGNNRLYVSQTFGSRVTVYDVSVITNGMNAANVLGAPDFTTANQSTTQALVNFPGGVAFDSAHNRLYVSGYQNLSRLTVFDTTTITNGENAVNVLGQTTFSATSAATTQPGMSSPTGMAYDSVADRLWVADSGNNRVTIYDVAAITNGENAVDLLGQYDQTSFTDPVPVYGKGGANDGANKFGFNSPKQLSLDTVNHRLFVADDDNKRVLVYNLSNTNTLSDHLVDNVLGQTNFYANAAAASQPGIGSTYGLAYDGTNNRLYVSQYTSANRVTVYDTASITDGENAVNVLGQTTFSGSGTGVTQPGLSNPTGLAMDPASNRLYVWDLSNNRVAIYNTSSITNGMNAVDLLGQYDETNFTDPVPAYAKSGENDGPNKFGFNTFGGSQLAPAFDGTHHRLFVTDGLNRRVLVYNLTAGNLLVDHVPDNVIGQPNFYTNTSATTQPGFSGMSAIAYDATNDRLYVGNSTNRISIFNTSSITDGMNAVNVLGQAGFGTNSLATTQAGFQAGNGMGIDVDATNNRLYVADSSNHRVMIFNTSTITDGMNAVNVLGKTVFNDSAAGNTQGGMNNPQGIAIDVARSLLYVSQSGNHRVTVYNVSTITNGMNAVNVIGQTTFSGNSSVNSQSGFNSPRGLFIDPLNNRLYIAEVSNSRVTIYNTSTITNGMNAMNVLGQTTFSGSGTATTQPGMNAPLALALDTTNNRLYVGDSNNSRLTIYDADPGKTISGTVYTDEGTANIGSGKTIAISINGAAAATTTTTNASGAFTLSNLALVANDVVTVYVDGAEDAVTVSKVAASNYTNFDLYQDHLISRCDNSCSLTNTNLDTADNNADADITGIYAVSGGNLTVASGKELFIPTSHTFAPGGNVTTPTFDLRGTYTHSTETVTISTAYQQSAGTFSASSGTVDINGNFTMTGGTHNATSGTFTISGDYSNVGGTFEEGSNTVTFDGSAAQALTGETFYNLTINNSAASPSDSVDVDSSAAVTVTNTLTVSDGQFSPTTASDFNGVTVTTNGILKPDSGASITVSGDWANTGTFTSNSGTVTFDGSVAQAMTGETFYNLTINNSAGTPSDSVDVDSSAAVTVTNALLVSDGQFQPTTASTFAAVSITTNGILAPDSSASITDSGNWTNSGTFTANSGTVNLTSTSSGATLTSGGSSFTNLTQNGSGGTYTLQDATTVSNVLTITAGTLNGGAVTLTLPGTTGTPLVVSDTFTPNTGTVTYTGNNGSGNTTITNVTYNNLTLNNASETYVLAGITTVGGDLTITNGTLDVVSGQNYALSVGGNWSNAGTFTAQNGTVTFTKSSGTQTLNTGGTSAGKTFYNLTHSGAGILQLITNVLTVTNNLTNSGGTLDANGLAINVAGNFDNNGGTYTANGNTFTLTGSNQSILGSTTFYNLTKTVSSAATLTFEAAKTFVVSSVLTLQGALNNLLSVVSSSLNTQFNINIPSSFTLNFLNVRDLNNSNATSRAISNSQNSDNNTNVTFTATTVTWTGTTSTNWAVATNWSTGYVPNTTDNVVIADVTNDPILDANRTVNNLTINSGGVLDVSSSNYALTVTGNFTNAGTFTARSGTVTLTSTSSGATLTSGGSSFYNVIQNGSGGTYTIQDALTTTNNLTITSGTFFLNGNNLSVAGTFTTGGTLMLSGTEASVTSPTNLTTAGTVAYNNSSPLSSAFVLGTTYYNLTFTGTDTLTLAADLTTNNTLTIDSGATLTLNDFDLNIAGNLVNSGTLNQDADSTITLNGVTQTLNLNSTNVAATLDISGSSGTTSLGSNFTVSNILSIAAGRTLSLVNYVIALGTNLLTNLGVITEGTGYIAGTSSNLYIADSSFDVDDVISLTAESIYVALIDQDANLNGQSADTLSGVVVSCPTDSETVTLTETGAATETFRSTGLATLLYAGSNTNNNGTLTCADGATVTATYTDPQDSGDTRSDTATMTTSTPPTAPSSLSGTAASATSITWTWTDNASNETGFRIYTASNVLIATISTANATSYTETGLTASTSYTRKILAYNSVGSSAYSSSATVATQDLVTVPTAPSLFTGTAASNTSITWTWTDNASNETGFKLLDSDNNAITTIATANTTTYTETSLTKNTSYTRKLVAYNADGNSTATSLVSVTTNNTSPAAFSLISPTDNTYASTGLPTFSFKKSSEAGGSISSYTLYVGGLTFTGIPAQGSAASNPASATDYENTYVAQYYNESDSNSTNDTISVTLRDGSTSLPLADGKYVWYVKAIDAEGASTISDDRTIYIDATSPVIVAANISTADTTPTLPIQVSDNRGLKELTVTLEKANLVLSVITSYSPIQTRTYTLTGKQEDISFTPRNALTSGKYRYTMTATDLTGHTTTTTVTLAILSAQEQQAAAIADLDPETSSPETIIETLRDALPDSPLNLPVLQEKAVVRRQLQAENFKTFLSALNYTNWPWESQLERLVASLFTTAEKTLAYLFGSASHLADSTLSWWQYLIHTTAQGGRYSAGATVAAYNNALHATLNTMSLALNGTIGRIAHVDFTSPFNRTADSLTLSRTTLLTGVRNFIAGVKNTGHFIAQYASAGRTTRIRQGLSNRQEITRGLERVWGPARGVGSVIALRARATYEIWFDRTPTKIMNLAMTDITPTSVTIAWDTNHLTHLGKVNYGVSTQYTEEMFEASGLRDHHSVTLNNLDPKTTYYFEVMNQNGGYVYDAYYTVTTLAEGSEKNSEVFVPQEAVIQGEVSVPVRKEPTPTSDVVKMLLPGTRLRALTEKDGWISVLLSSGQEVWLERDAVLLGQQGVSATAQH